MAVSNIKALIPGELQKVWDLVLDIENYGAWRSDLSKAEVISDKKFIEYTKEGYPTTFTVTLAEPYRRWEFDMENSNMTGHWTGIFTAKGDETEIDFTEQVEAKKWLLKPFVKSYLRKQQTQFVADIMKIFHKDLYIGRRFVMKKYEYMTVDLSAEPSFNVHIKLDRYIEKLNEYGKQGWRLISGMDDWKYSIFEREIDDEE